MGRRLLSLLTAAALAAGLSACGGSSEATPATTPGSTSDHATEADISQAQIDALPAKAPQRAVLEWWRALQLNDPESARAFYLDPPAPPDLAGQFNFLAGHVEGGAKALSIEKKGGVAGVRVLWSPPDEKPRKVTLRLRRQDGAWKLLDARFLDVMVAELQEPGGGG